MVDAEVSLRGWLFAVVRVLLALTAGAALGLFVGNLWAGLAATLAMYLTFHLYNLFRLDYWLNHRSVADPPDAGGLWGDVVARVVRLHRRKRFHKQRMIEIFRELRRSTASMPDGVATLNRDHEIIWFNRTASRLLGLKRKLDFGLRIDNLIRHPEFVRYLHAGQYGSPVVIRPNVSEPTWLSIQLVPYGEAQKLMLVRDVTRQQQLEQMRKEFVANASHELRSPLTVIAGYLETLASDSSLDRDLRQPVDEMRRQAERMTTIIQDLLVLSKLEDDESEIEGAPIDVIALITLLRKEVLARGQRTGEVLLNIESDATLIGDETQIHSAFANLVENAVKYTPESGAITLRWWVDDDGAHFSVADVGKGIPAQHIPRLTERFYRVDEGRSRATGGSGLGLAIVKHALQRHGGRLEIQSVEGRGSTFACRFPSHRIAPATARHEPQRVRA